MSITDELRKYAEKLEMAASRKSEHGFSPAAMKLTAIADRIDAEHEMATSEFWAKINAVPATDENMAEHGWVRLPVDADGEVWHVGDFAVGEVNPRNPKAIERMIWYGPDSGWQLETDTIIYPCPDRPRHHHAPTVEDVLREFFSRYVTTKPKEEDDAIIAEYAAKLQLAGDAE